ncbi:MAG: D-alanyl-D-alanine carboxypeptidase [Lachnospiraceae bacterium]|nr:D-alanyl-D-alanine carboxypeptidase [Lachnospiraceae bacterium]
MKKVISFLLIISICLCFCGCDNKDKVLYMSYNDFNNVNAIIDSSTGNSSNEQLFASNVCVVPLGQDNGGDDKLTGKAEILVNVTDNTICYADNIYEKLYPASITKIMTTLTALKHSDLDAVVEVSTNSGGITESGAKLCKLKKGQKIVLRDLITAMLTYSGNDAGIEVANFVAGSVEEFAKLMNQDAKELGCVSTNFVNPHGLHDDNHYTTAYDLYLIYNELLKYDFFLEASSRVSFDMPYTDTNGKAKSSKYDNTNSYIIGTMSPPEGIIVTGGKTGTTIKAGKCLAVSCTDSDNKQYVAIVLYACDMSSDLLYTQMNELLSQFKK